MFTYITFNTGTEIICFLAALICLSGKIDRVWKLLIPYLFMTCVVEFIGVYLKRHQHANQWPYNILLMAQIVIPSLVFMHLFTKYTKSKVIIASGVTILVGFYIYDTISHGFLWFDELTYNVMSVLYVIYCLYYFYLLLNAEYYVELKYSASFWLVVGALFFYFGSTAINLFRIQLTPILISKYNITYYIYIVLNIILYGCWTYSFICKRWLTKTLKT